MKPLFEVSSIVPASIDEVRKLFDEGWVLRTALGGQDGAGGPAGSTGSAETYVDIDSTPQGFSMQGHWWYRGEWSVEDAAGQSRLINRVFNIARSQRWAVPLANKFFIGYRAALQEGIDDLARQISEHIESGG